MKVKELTEEQRKALIGDTCTIGQLIELREKGIVNIGPDENGETWVELTPAGIALREELMKEANDEDV